MAIPTETLTLDVDIDSLTLDDIELFEGGGFKVKKFKAFMTAHSNWTAEQVGKLTVAEMREVALKISDALRVAAVPKATPPA